MSELDTRPAGTSKRRGQVISFVLPFYNEGINVEKVHATLLEVTSGLPYEIEFVYVNDGSSDDTFDRLIAVRQTDPRVVVINFARNFGHQRAITAGMDHSVGDAIVIMDSDLQDPPRVALELIEKWEEGYDVVYAQRRTRKDTFVKKFTADAYYRILESIGDIKIPRNTGDFRLMDRKVVDEVKKFREHDRYMRGIVSSVGFRQVGVQFDRDERQHGETHYTWNKMFKLAADGILGFSTFPLTIISRIGYAMGFLAVLGIVWVVVGRFTNPGSVVQGWSLTIIVILFVGGLQLVTLGILGSYIGRIYREVQDRPLYSIEGIYRSKPAKGVEAAPVVVQPQEMAARETDEA